VTIAIETVGLTRKYGRTQALSNLNLRIARGSIYGFIGPNGAGKTTTLRLLAGLLEPTSGTIAMMGERLRPGGAQQLVGYMPDFFGVYDDLRTWEYLDFFARCYGLSTKERRRSIEELLDLVDLTPQRNAFVQTLSRGMQQRLCLAHALVHNPPVLLLDEPASGLDPRARVELRELLRTLREMGKTILLSSHVLSELAEVCTEIGIIDRGRLIADGTVEDVRSQLQSGARLRIRVLSDIDLARVILAEMQHADGEINVPAIQAVYDDPSDPRGLIIEAPELDEAHQTRLLAFLVQRGVPVSEFRAQPENLEELFLRITAG
jgi:ABC-2 type transport system ATP-binding protein